MTSPDLSQFIRTYTDEVWNQRNPAAMPKFYSDAYVHHDVSRPDVRSLANYQQWARDLITAFPDLQVEIHDIIADSPGSKAVKRWTATGTHNGPLGDLPPSSKKVSFSGVSSYRVETGKIVESWYVYDLFGLLTQLGALGK
jgi:steroid delta-isomerase-like uncharacterized protein